MSKHRVALIGMLSGKAAIPDCCELVGLCDIKEDLIKKMKEEHPDILCTTDYHEIAAMPNCDTVVTWTPNATHRDIAVACLKGGKNVFIEKPMGTTLQEGIDILTAEKESGKYVGVDLEYRWGQLAQWVKELLDSGEIGELRHFEFDHHRGGWLHDTSGGTYRTKAAYSGLMRMEGIHYIDLFRYWFGDIEQIRAFAFPNTLPHYEIPDNMTLIMNFPNGLMGRYTTSHNKVGYIYSNGDSGPELGHESKWAICGTKGLIRIDGWKHRIDIYHAAAQPAGTNSLKMDFDRSLDWSRMSHPFSTSHDISGHRVDFMRRMSAGQPPFERAEEVHIAERISFAIDQMASPEGPVIDCTKIQPV